MSFHKELYKFTLNIETKFLFFFFLETIYTGKVGKRADVFSWFWNGKRLENEGRF
jgi:hypothetical protein